MYTTHLGRHCLSYKVTRLSCYKKEGGDRPTKYTLNDIRWLMWEERLGWVLGFFGISIGIFGEEKKMDELTGIFRFAIFVFPMFTFPREHP